MSWAQGLVYWLLLLCEKYSKFNGISHGFCHMRFGVASSGVSGSGSLLRSQSTRTAVTWKVSQGSLMVGKLVSLHMGFSVKSLNGLMTWAGFSQRKQSKRPRQKQYCLFLSGLGRHPPLPLLLHILLITQARLASGWEGDYTRAWIPPPRVIIMKTLFRLMTTTRLRDMMYLFI